MTLSLKRVESLTANNASTSNELPEAKRMKVEEDAPVITVERVEAVDEQKSVEQPDEIPSQSSLEAVSS